ncbi:MAG: sialate O-acetylesterase [Mucilaginibacter sp.]|nr:sialate O-acetylesterase [Mucilaginibacter sp.]
MSLKPSIIRYFLISSIALNLIALCFAVRRLYYTQVDFMKQPEFYPAEQRERFAELPINTSDIVFIGDSEIEYFNTSELLPGMPIKNRGIGGDNVKELYSRIPDVLKYHPRKLFIEIGTNDIHGKTSIDSFAFYIQKTIQITKKMSPSTSIFCLSILPRQSLYKEQVINFNNILKTSSTRSGATFIDVYNQFSSNGTLNKIYDCGDSLHLNAKAYTAWSALLKPYL